MVCVKAVVTIALTAWCIKSLVVTTNQSVHHNVAEVCFSIINRLVMPEWNEWDWRSPNIQTFLKVARSPYPGLSSCKWLGFMPADLCDGAVREAEGGSSASFQLPSREDGRSIPVECFWPPQQETADPASPLPLIVFFHSGGLIVGSVASEAFKARALAKQVRRRAAPPLSPHVTTQHTNARTNALLARQVGALVCSVEYRRAPEHTFPAVTEDSVDATLALMDGAAGVPRGVAARYSSRRTALCGFSAGGYVAAQTALHLADLGRGKEVALQVLGIPMAAPFGGTESMVRHAQSPVWGARVDHWAPARGRALAAAGLARESPSGAGGACSRGGARLRPAGEARRAVLGGQGLRCGAGEGGAAEGNPRGGHKPPGAPHQRALLAR